MLSMKSRSDEHTSELQSRGHEVPTLELELLPGTDLAEVKAILDNPNVTIIPPAAMSDEATEPPAEPNT